MAHTAPAVDGSGPHRHPFRLIDRTDPDGRARVVVSAGAVLVRAGLSLPLTLAIEIMAQGALAAMNRPAGLDGSAAGEGTGLRLAGIDGARLHRPARPGDRLWVTTEVAGRFGSLTKASCRLEGADGDLVAEASLLLAGS